MLLWKDEHTSIVVYVSDGFIFDLQVTALTTAPVSIAPKRALEEQVEHQTASEEPINKQIKTEQTAEVSEWSTVLLNDTEVKGQCVMYQRYRIVNINMHWGFGK